MGGPGWPCSNFAGGATLIYLLVLIGTCAGVIKVLPGAISQNIQIEERSGFTMSNGHAPLDADDTINMDFKASKVVKFSDIRDIVSLEIVQHKKVKLVLNNGDQNTETVTAQLLSGQWPETDLVSHTISHTDHETVITLSLNEVGLNSAGVSASVLWLSVAMSVLLSVLLYTCYRRRREKQRNLGGCSCQEEIEERTQKRKSQEAVDAQRKTCFQYHDLVTNAETITGAALPPLSDSLVALATNNSSQTPGEGQSSPIASQEKKASIQLSSRCPHCAALVMDDTPSSRSSEQGGQGCTDRGRFLTLCGVLGLSCLGVFLLVSVCSVTGPQGIRDNDLPVLKVTVPRETHIRKIRSYSENPDLKDVDFSNEDSRLLVSRLQLLELSAECTQNVSQCRTHALCNQTRPGGGFTCRCNRGYYLEGLTCKACTTSCPADHYMVQQCSTETDVICKSCSVCGGTEYPAASCTTTQDTLCLDVSFPLGHNFRHSTLTEDMISWNVSMSNNVFLERLHNIKKLETTLYVANNNQEMQFVFKRPSGLQVEVALSNVYLVPEYVDLDHEDDLGFLSRSKSFAAKLKAELLNVTTTYCRNPIPDEYFLYVNITRNTSTLASEITCDGNDHRVPACPKGYKDGDKYITKELDKECPKVDGPKPFRDLPNNVLCADNPMLLKSVFKMAVKDSLPLRFPSPECVNYQMLCDSCLSQRTCSRGSNVSDCCNVGCYGRSACRNLYKDICPPTPVECIRGDITKFGLVPRYTHLEKQFACHLEHVPPATLYRVTYTARIPSLQFNFKTHQKDVRYQNMSHQETGTVQADYLSMRHTTVIPLNNQVVLVRKKNNDTEEYTLNRLKKPWEFERPGDFSIDQRAGDIYRTKVQFERPFLYSTANWEDGGCDRDVSQIYPSQTVYKEHGIKLTAPIRKEANGSFMYELLSAGPAPHIKFMAPENMSILSYYQDDYKDSWVIGSKLSGDIVWDTKKQLWLVTISGTLTSCPGCFTLELYSEPMRKRLVQYDMFINCPTDFSIKFTIERPTSENLDIFVAVINDTVASHRLVITSVHGPQYFALAGSEIVAMPTNEQSPWIPIIVVLVVCSLSSLGLLGLYVALDSREAYYPPIAITLPKPDLGAGITLLQNLDKTQPSLSLNTQLVAGLLIVLYLVYALLFTFSSMFGMLHVIQAPNTGAVTHASNTSTHIQAQVEHYLQDMVDYESRETVRLISLVRDRQRACSVHLERSVQKAVPNVHEAFENLLDKVFSNNGTVSAAVQSYFRQQVSVYETEIQKFLNEFNETLESNLHKAHTTYAAYLKHVAESPWLEFPRKVFLDQQRAEGRGRWDVREDWANFLTWLQVDKVQEIIAIKDILLKKLSTLMPKVDFSPVPDDLPREVITASVFPNLTVPIQWFKFTTTVPNQTFVVNKNGSKSRDRSRNWSANLENETDTTGSKTRNKTLADSLHNSQQTTIQNMKSILYPVFIGMFLMLDACLLVYRFSWLVRSLRHFKSGIEDRVPYDSITRKIHFILTGRDIPRPGECLDHPYDYYRQNKDNIWKDNTDLYFLYCQASPKSKEDILREIWSHKQKQKKKLPEVEITDNFHTRYFTKIIKLIYRMFISPVFWRFILICAFVLFTCLVTKATDDLVTIDSAMFLMDTEAMLPVLERQNSITNTAILQYGTYLNDLLAHYKDLLDSEIQILNSMMIQVTEKQRELIQSLLLDMCNLRGANSCTPPPSLELFTTTLTSCNFLPVHPQTYTGFHEDILTQFIQGELNPVVSSLRKILFTTFVLLLSWAGAMLFCQICARIIYVFLIKTGHLRTTKVYQLPSTIEWTGQQSFRDEKEIYVSQSLIAESCESGVYDMTT